MERLEHATRILGRCKRAGGDIGGVQDHEDGAAPVRGWVMRFASLSDERWRNSSSIVGFENMTQGTVTVNITEGIATVTLNRPSSLNALAQVLYNDLNEALNQVESDLTVRVLVITGAGRGFCAGQDLAERAAGLALGEIDLGALIERNANPLIRRLMSFHVPVIAAVNGIAAGAGACLALAADIVVAARSASFVLSFAKVALGPDAGASWILQRQIGTARAMGMMLTAAPISAERAEEWGMIWQCVADEELQGTARGLATMIRRGPQAAYAAARALAQSAREGSLDDALDRERDSQADLGRAGMYREAVNAFMEKRSPRFVSGMAPLTPDGAL